jgi:gluconokinase
MILIIAGVAGSGKTTVGRLISSRLSWTFADADSFHSEANLAKMRASVPLTDEDRWPWLDAICAWMDNRIRDGESAVVACSALKQTYRRRLLDERAEAVMAFLSVTFQDDEDRVHARKDHFFGEPLLASQFATLEVPQDEDRVHVVTTDGRPADQIADVIISLLDLA